MQAVQGSRVKRPFICMACRKEVTPTRNILIEEHIIWKNMCRTYGSQDMLDLTNDSENNFNHLIRKSVQCRLIHLQSRFQTLQSLLDASRNTKVEQYPKDQVLIDDVNRLYIQLENLTERLKRTEAEMERRGTMVDTCLEKYKKCMKNFDRLCELPTESVTTIENQPNRRDLCMYKLDMLSSEQNVPAIEDILEDIEFRERCFLDSKQIRSSSSQATTDDAIEKIDQKLRKLSDIKDELQHLLRHLKSLKNYIDEYDALLRDELFPHIPCSKFILLLERMRVRTEEFDISNNFSKTDALMRTWKNHHGTDDEFKPKVVKLCQALEEDVQNLFRNFNWVYSVPYKIGVIGCGSVGKSALVVNLTEVTTFSAMIDFERSTFGYLQFDTRVYKDPVNGRVIPITFVDIEGATDADSSESPGNYLQLIKKADCDLYIIVFDNLFSKHNRDYQEYIENELARQCLLVRSKADLLFSRCFRESYGKNYETKSSKEYHKKVVLNQIKNHAQKTFDDQRLDKTVYLTATMCEDNLKDAPFAEFDLKALKKKLIQYAKTDVRIERICYLGIRSAVRVINTCFRRGYVVSQTKYKWLSAGASIIPFLNEIPAFYGREKIRQVFGIHDNSTLTNFVNRTQNILEYYLIQRKLSIPKEKLKSGEFQYLIAKTTTATPEARPDSVIPTRDREVLIERACENITKTLSVTSTVGIAVARNTATIGLRTASVVGIVANLVLSPVVAAWSFRSTGQGMNNELHSICDDLTVIFQYFILNRCEEFCSKIPPLSLTSSDESSSSSDTDDDYFST